MWKTVKLGDVCLVRRGTTITKKQTIEGTIPVIGGGTKPTYYHNQANREANCITVSGSGASAGFVNKWEQEIFASDCSTVEPHDENQLNQFVYYYLLSRQQYIYDNFRSGAAQPHVYAKDIATLPFPVITLAEQQRIIAKLDAAFTEIDRAIESYEESILNAKECLSKLRASRITELLGSSKVAKLGSLASLKNGLNYNKSEKGYSVKILGVGDFGKKFSIGTEELELVETNSPISTDYHLEHGDIVFVRSNGNKQLIGRSIVILNPREPATFSGFCIRCRIEIADMSPLFLCHYLKSSVVRDKLIYEGGGANISNLNQKMLADIDVPLLPPHEQITLIRWIEELERSFEDYVETLIKRVQLADNLKSAILAQELRPSEAA